MVALPAATGPLLVVLLGPTASGKTALSLSLAERFDGEIVSCDSVAVYREMEIGTAKPSREERQRLVAAVKGLALPIQGTLGFEKAEVTTGGVALDEVDPTTLESRLVPGLHFAGEVLDLDGLIGGYNFQAAWSTGWLAGETAATMVRG